MNERDFEIKILIEILQSSSGVGSYDTYPNSSLYGVKPRDGAIKNLLRTNLIEHVVKQTYKLTSAGYRAAELLNYSLNKEKERMEF